MSITINFRQHTYKTTIDTIQNKGENIITTLLECDDVDNDIFIDRDGTHFGHILNYLSESKIPTTTSIYEKKRY